MTAMNNEENRSIQPKLKLRFLLQQAGIATAVAIGSKPPFAAVTSAVGSAGKYCRKNTGQGMHAVLLGASAHDAPNVAEIQ